MYYKKYDILIYAVIVFFLIICLYKYKYLQDVKAKRVEIHVDGKLAYRYKLTKEKRVISYESGHGKEEIVIENYTVKKTKATCPRKFCLKQGEIKEVGEMIICAPNRTIIKITGDEDKGYDYILK